MTDFWCTNYLIGEEHSKDTVIRMARSLHGRQEKEFDYKQFFGRAFNPNRVVHPKTIHYPS